MGVMIVMIGEFFLGKMWQRGAIYYASVGTSTAPQVHL